MTALVHATALRLYHGDAAELPHAGAYDDVDLILTNPYGPLPRELHGRPMLIHQWRHRQAEAEEWCGNKLVEVAAWNRDKEVFWAANVGEIVPVDLSEFVPTAEGWYPPELPVRLLRAYGSAGITVWDGFMGRGTVGRAARSLGMNYIGVEQLEAHLALALDYLGVTHGVA